MILFFFDFSFLAGILVYISGGVNTVPGLLFYSYNLLALFDLNSKIFSFFTKFE